MNKVSPIIRVALPTPLRRNFDYLLPPDTQTDLEKLKPGMRVKVPFGNRKRQLVGVILETTNTTHIEHAKLKNITAILDDEPLLTSSLMQLLTWASNYYHHSIGEVIATALPRLLKNGQPAIIQSQQCFRITPAGKIALEKKSKKITIQITLLQLLQQHPEGLNYSQLSHAGFQRNTLAALLKKNLLQTELAHTHTKELLNPQHKALALNAAQKNAIETIIQQKNFKTFLLDGVTGSGKTEVYLNVIENVLRAEKQALILVPEIGLTPQTVTRFSQRFLAPIVVLHSGLTDQERLDAWLMAKQGLAKIVIGTRSAIFTPLPHLGAIILDEVHDLSFKQQSGLRYSARDLAIMRGQLENCPVILGSATPSLENFYNVKNNRFVHLILPERAGRAIQPTFHIIDIRNQRLEEGLSNTLLQAINKHLTNDGQVLLFLNRRGFAPILLCHQCGWSAQCSRCDARLILHQKPTRLYCHHCDFNQANISQCPACNSKQLLPVGLGTERLEQALQQHFPNENILRIDRDNIRNKEAMHRALDTIHAGHSRILIGTQMLAKGHHFPNVTLVAIINGDSGLYSADFRAMEHMGQLLLQVAGRAGRAEKPGEVFIQTHNPNHPLLLQLIQQGYADFAASLLVERENMQLPPYSHLALIRAESVTPKVAMHFLQQVRNHANKIVSNNSGVVNVLGPIPSLMERKAGRYRAQLLLQSIHRKALHQLLNELITIIENLKASKQVRWLLDVDPVEL